MKIVYMGTPEFSKTCLNELITNNFNIRLVITNEDKKTGRGMKQMKTPVKILAEENNIEVYQPKSLRNYRKNKKNKSRYYCCCCIWKNFAKRGIRNTKIWMYKSTPVHYFLNIGEHLQYNNLF